MCFSPSTTQLKNTGDGVALSRADICLVVSGRKH